MVELNAFIKGNIMEKRTHKNYDIISTISFPAEEYVLGVKTINDNKEYVTWCCVEKTTTITDTTLTITIRLLKTYMNVQKNT